MLRINGHAKTLKQLDQPKISEAGFKERHDIQHMIRNSPNAFFAEMGEKLLLIGEEVRPTEFVDDRVDLLAIDQEGAVVVMELKRGSNKLQLLQAITYAAMLSKWRREDLTKERTKLTTKTEEEVGEEIDQFLQEDIVALNQSQRVLLLAGDFDYEVLVTAEWLTEQYEMDIRCYRLGISTDGGSEFLTATCIYPPPEITKYAARRSRRGHETDLAERHILRLKFWEQLLSRAKEKGVTLHAGRAPTKEMWISGGVGKAGLSLNYVIWLEEKTAVELYIDTGDREQNKRIYDLFYSKKEKIETDFGGALVWERLDDKRASRIRIFIEKGGLKEDETHWPPIQDAMIDAMNRLSKALMPHIQALS